MANSVKLDLSLTMHFHFPLLVCQLFVSVSMSAVVSGYGYGGGGDGMDLPPIPLSTLPSMFSPNSSTLTTLLSPSSRLPSNLSGSQIDQTTSSIRSTLALYPLAIDGKNFPALSTVFAPNAAANYSSPLNVLSPLPGIEKGLKESLECVNTQHSLGTQAVRVLNEDYAVSVTYYTAVHVGREGRMKKEVATAHGQYQDLWERMPINGTQGGGWKIVYRNLVYMVSSLSLIKVVLICRARSLGTRTFLCAEIQSLCT